MKKLLILALAAVATAPITSARVLTPDEALARATVSKSGLAKAPSTSSMTLLHEIRNDGVPAVYIFDRKDDKGFLILSADDCAPSILGFADDGSAALALKPSAMQYWLENLASEIASMRNSVTTALATERSSAPKNDIAPMCKTLWGQDAPYNNDCPLDSDNKRSVTGCVATAMAQIIRYHAYPTQGQGTKEYQWTNSANVKSTLTFDYQTTFNFAAMKDSYNGAYSASSAAEVAKLMYACGVGVEMGYSSSESGAVSTAVPAALIDYFKYDKGLHIAFRRSYYSADWNDLIYENLSEFGPIYFSGRNATGGHAFVCDGYQDGYYHFNWGWEGISNGYFLLSALNPQAQGTGGSSGGYDEDQQVILGITPEQHNATPYYVVAWGNGVRFAQSTTDDKKITLSGSTGPSQSTGIYNYGGITIPSVTFGYEIVDAANESTFGGTVRTSALKANYGLSGYNVTLPSLAAGTYTLYSAYSTDNGITWLRTPATLSCGTSATITVSATGKYTVADNSVLPLALGGNPSCTPLYVDSSFKIKLPLKNPNNVEYSGSFYPAFGTVSNGRFTTVARGLSTSVILEPDATEDVDYVGEFYTTGSNQLTAGNYTMVFVDASGNIIDGQGYSVTINEANTASVQVTNFAVTNSGAADQNELTMTGNLTLTSGSFFGNPLILYIFPSTGGTSLQGSMTPTFFASGSAATPITISTSFTAGVPNKSYFAMLHDGAGWVSNQAYFTLSPTSSIEDVITDTNVTNEYYNLQGVRVNNPGNGAYIKIETSADGTRHASKRLSR